MVLKRSTAYRPAAMKRRDGSGGNRFAALIFFVLLFSVSTVFAGAKESWYVMHGKANMKIKNYRAAIEAFEKVCEMNPDNREAMRLLGVAYDAQGLMDKAIQQYCRYLDRFGDDAGIAFKTGDLLQWSRYNYRKGDALKYYRMGLAVEYDQKYHHAVAKLLAADKSTLDEAVKEYRKLMDRYPENREYHREYRKLLLWDEKYVSEAVAEYKILAENNPHDYAVNREYARLLARGKSRGSETQRQYKVLLAMRPDDREVRLEYAMALAGEPGKFDESRCEFEKALAGGGGVKAREAYADLLAGRKSTRDEAAGEYRKVLDAGPEKTGVRLKYASILGEEKSTLPQAIEQYKIVLKREPNNVHAHNGLANAYAWEGDTEKAVFHAQRAAKLGSAQAITLKRKLMTGREPYAGGNLCMTVHPGDWYGITGYTLLGRSRIRLFRDNGAVSGLPGMVLYFDGGVERYSAGTPYLKTASGVVMKAAVDYHFSPDKLLFSRFGYHTLPHVGDGFEADLHYSYSRDRTTLRAGYGRELVNESVFALAGHRDSAQTPLGAARTNRFFGELHTKYRFLEATAEALFGWVSVQTAGANTFIGANAEPLGRIPLGDESRNLTISYYAEVKHYDRDFSGFEVSLNDTMPQPGGYFSPQAFVGHSPRIGYHDGSIAGREIRISIGPRFSHAQDPTSERNGSGLSFLFRYSGMFTSTIRMEATFEYGRGPHYSYLTIGTFLYRIF